MFGLAYHIFVFEATLQCRACKHCRCCLRRDITLVTEDRERVFSNLRDLVYKIFTPVIHLVIHIKTQLPGIDKFRHKLGVLLLLILQGSCEAVFVHVL